MIVMCGIPAATGAAAMGMYCTVTQRYDNGNNTWAQITNMATRTGFPETVRSGDSLILSAGPQLLTARAEFAGSVPDVAIYINGVKVVDSLSQSTPAKEITHALTAVGGEVATIWMNPYSTGNANRVVTAGETSTYLTATPT